MLPSGLIDNELNRWFALLLLWYHSNMKEIAFFLPEAIQTNKRPIYICVIVLFFAAKMLKITPEDEIVFTKIENGTIGGEIEILNNSQSPVAFKVSEKWKIISQLCFAPIFDVPEILYV